MAAAGIIGGSRAQLQQAEGTDAYSVIKDRRVPGQPADVPLAFSGREMPLRDTPKPLTRTSVSEIRVVSRNPSDHHVACCVDVRQATSDGSPKSPRPAARDTAGETLRACRSSPRLADRTERGPPDQMETRRRFVLQLPQRPGARDVHELPDRNTSRNRNVFDSEMNERGEFA